MIAEDEEELVADARRDPTRRRQRRLLGVRVKLLTGRYYIIYVGDRHIYILFL